MNILWLNIWAARSMLTILRQSRIFARIWYIQCVLCEGASLKCDCFSRFSYNLIHIKHTECCQFNTLIIPMFVFKGVQSHEETNREFFVGNGPIIVGRPNRSSRQQWYLCHPSERLLLPRTKNWEHYTTILNHAWILLNPSHWKNKMWAVVSGRLLLTGSSFFWWRSCTSYR